MAGPSPALKAGALLGAIAAPVIGLAVLRVGPSASASLLLLVALLLAVVGTRTFERHSGDTEEAARTGEVVRAVAGWAPAVVLSLAAVVLSGSPGNDVRAQRLAALSWLATMPAGLIGVAATRRLQRRAPGIGGAGAVHAGVPAAQDTPSSPAMPPTETESTSREASRPALDMTDAVAMVLLFAVAVVVRSVWLPMHPYPWSGDEASVGLEGRRVLAGAVVHLFETGWSSQPNWSFVPTALAQWLAGDSIVAVRLPSVLAGACAVVATYLAGRELFGRIPALVAGAVLSTLPYHVHFSRIGVHNIHDSLMSALVCWLLAVAARTNRTAVYYAAGVASGLCLYSYVGTRLVAILAVGTLVAAACWSKAYRRTQGRGMATFGVALAITAAPQALFFAKHPDIFRNRLNTEGLLFNGWVAHQAAETGRSVVSIVGDQISRTLLVFVATPAQGLFFNSPEPYLGFVASVLLLSGLVYVLAHVTRPQHLVVLAWLGAVLLLGGVLTMNPPAHTRLLGALPPVALLIGVGGARLLATARQFRIVSPRAGTIGLALVVTLVAGQQAWFYLGEYRTRMYFQDVNSEFAMEVGLIARDLAPGTDVYVVGAPRVYAGIPTTPFLVREQRLADLGREAAADVALEAGRTAAFFVIPEYRDTFEALAARFPHARRGVVHRRPRPDEPLFDYLVVEAGP